MKPAAAMLRRTSSSVARRGPSVGSSIGETRSRWLAPNVSATCASFGPYCCQSTSIVPDRSAGPAAPARPAGRRDSRSSAPRPTARATAARSGESTDSSSMMPRARSSTATRPSPGHRCTDSVPRARPAATHRRHLGGRHQIDRRLGEGIEPGRLKRLSTSGRSPQSRAITSASENPVKPRRRTEAGPHLA